LQRRAYLKKNRFSINFALLLRKYLLFARKGKEKNAYHCDMSPLLSIRHPHDPPLFSLHFLFQRRIVLFYKKKKNSFPNFIAKSQEAIRFFEM
jgi:hypothetical protein